jgi:PLP dependent protein
MSITENYKCLHQEIPDNVTIVVAAKKRTPQELVEAIEAGATDIDE